MYSISRNDVMYTEIIIFLACPTEHYSDNYNYFSRSIVNCDGQNTNRLKIV